MTVNVRLAKRGQAENKLVMGRGFYCKLLY
jgi:hypothetical protein